MSVLRMPEPSGWARAGRPLLRATVAGLAISVFPVVYFVRSLLRESYPTAIILAGMSLGPAILLIALQFVHRGRTLLRAEHASTGTVMLLDSRIAKSLMISLGLVAVSLLASAVSIQIGEFDLVMSRGQAVWFTCIAGFGGLFGLVGLYTVWQRGGVGYVELAPNGIEIANAVQTDFVVWDEIVEVADSTEEKRTRRAVVLRLREGDEKVIDGADFYVPGGATLYWMIRHYWSHPEDRSELVDGRAMERLRNGQFETA